MGESDGGAVSSADRTNCASTLAERIFGVLAELDHEADTVRNGYATGLRWLHAHLGRTGRDTTEDAISEALAARLPDGTTVQAAAAQMPYPSRARRLDDGVTRGTCDLVLELEEGAQAWIEVKGAWTYLRERTRLRSNRSYRKHLVDEASGAARDFAKVAALLPEVAALVGVLVVAFDLDEPGSRWEMTDADLTELEAAAGIRAGRWQRFDAAWPDPHAARVFGDAQSERCRTRCHLWLRAAEPLERLAALLRRRNALDAQIARLIGRPAERGHLGEFIAAHVFDIELYDSAVHKGADGVFRGGPFAGHTVNVKFYGAQEGILDAAVADPPDTYLVLTGPKRSAASSRGLTRPLVIENAYLFHHAALVAAGVKPGVAASVRQHLWEAARVYPTAAGGAPALLMPEQAAKLEQFGTRGFG